MADPQAPNPMQPDTAGAREEGRTATRVRGGASPVAIVVLVTLLGLGIVWLVAIDRGWSGWVVLGAFLAVAIGMLIAINPRRNSPSGGTAKH